MPSWLRRVAGLDSSKWSDEEDNLGPPLDISMNEKSHDFTKSGMPTPATSTAVDHILPPPALHPHDSRRIKTKSARLGFGVYWMRLKKQLGAGVAPSNSSLIGDSAADSSCTRRPEPPLDEDGEVNEVVVDRVWTTTSEASSGTDEEPSEHGGSPPLDKSVAGQGGNTVAGDSSDHDSVDHDSFWRMWKPLVVIRYKFYPTLREFFFTRFADEKSESHYAQVFPPPSLILLLSLTPILGRLDTQKVFGNMGGTLAYCKLGTWSRLSGWGRKHKFPRERGHCVLLCGMHDVIVYCCLSI